MPKLSYTTPSGIAVTRSDSQTDYKKGLKHLLRKLDRFRGIYLSSGYEYPERYSRWDIASICPPLEIVAAGRAIDFRPLNRRGEALLRFLFPVLEHHPHWDEFGFQGAALRGRLKPLPKLFPEEERSKQPSAFSILRTLMEEFRGKEDARLALVGAFGYDLLFQFDPIELKLPRAGQKDLHLFLCDDIYYMDRKKERVERYRYDFARDGVTTAGLGRNGSAIHAGPKRLTLANARGSEASSRVPLVDARGSVAPLQNRDRWQEASSAGDLVRGQAEALRQPLGKGEIAPSNADIVADHQPEEYMAMVETVREGMRLGEYYEVVLRQTFQATFSDSPSELFERIQLASPSPYEFFLQLGDEQLVGASPEMFVRVEGNRVETCPIAGTARRTGDPLRDADNIRELLNSTKEESELTMCSDVDRNDKSRVSVPGSVRVIGRRLIESYAGVFHTVDHVEGILQPGFDSLDAFLTHMWAVTVIGAPKKAAAQVIEKLEKDARGWYGGAVGMLSMNGDINTGILIRTVHLRDGIARYGVGATLLYDSVPALEEEETRLKATGFFRALRAVLPKSANVATASKAGRGVKLLLIDNDDCFIHTLSNYARQTGAEVATYRAGVPPELISEIAPHLILISPGPGRPSDFGVPGLVKFAARAGIPVFGVCLGLQGIVEAFGGELGVLDYPMHGKPSVVIHQGKGVFEGLPKRFKVGRYHSLFARRETFPACLEITAESEDGIIMGVRHRDLPIEAVQFHPESILTLDGDCGLHLIENVVAQALACSAR